MSLQQIENDDWGDPDPDDTGLVKRCMWLRRKPLDEFDDADLYDLIMQRISWPILVPMALSRLAVDPWLDCDVVTAVLLRTVARVKDEYWQANPDQTAELEGIVERVIGLLEDDPGYMPAGQPHEWPSEWFPGDTVDGAMGIPECYWQAHPGQFARMCDVVARASEAGLLDGTSRALRALYLQAAKLND